jgi:serine/threonine protein kinase
MQVIHFSSQWLQNVLLVKERGKLCDFGISRLKVGLRSDSSLYLMSRCAFVFMFVMITLLVHEWHFRV